MKDFDISITHSLMIILWLSLSSSLWANQTTNAQTKSDTSPSNTPLLGIAMKDASEAFHQFMPQYQSLGAVKIRQVLSGSKAANKDFVAGDFIFQINQHHLDLQTPVQSLKKLINTFKVGDTIRVKSLRVRHSYQIHSNHKEDTSQPQTFDDLTAAQEYLARHPYHTLSLRQKPQPKIIEQTLKLGSSQQLPKLPNPPSPLSADWNNTKSLVDLFQQQGVTPNDLKRFKQLMRNDSSIDIPGPHPLHYHLQQQPESGLDVLQKLALLAKSPSNQLTTQLFQGFYTDTAKNHKTDSKTDSQTRIIINNTESLLTLVPDKEAIINQLFQLLAEVRRQNQQLSSLGKTYAKSLARLKSYYQDQDEINVISDPNFHQQLHQLADKLPQLKTQSHQVLARLSHYFNSQRVALIQDALSQLEQPQRIHRDGLTILLGTPKNDRHYIGADLIIDPHGDDRYFVSTPAQSKPIIIDLGGDDLYQSRIDHQWAGAQYGISYLLDWSGHDHYLSKDFSIASAFLGFALLHDKQGNDSYSAAHLSMASALLGSAVLRDDEGDDRYLSGTVSQAAGLFMGEAFLIEGEGDDHYTSSGWRDSAYTDEGSYDAIAMGVGLGLRGVCRGGVGILLDRQGNDDYHAGNFSMGSGYYFGLGGLLDMQGDDQYQAMRYAIASAAHSAIGLFWDDTGDDQYISTQHAIAGAAWDLSIALFVDRFGDDLYQSNGPFAYAAAEHNSFAIHQDQSGHDRYSGGFFSTQKNRYHNGQSLGIFINHHGDDQYPNISAQSPYQNQFRLKKRQFIFQDR